jgi:hypothetical protein
MSTATLRGRRGVTFERAVVGCVRGWLLVLDKPPLVPIGEAFANIVPDPVAEVWGVAYDVSDADLVHIDLTEGVPIGNYTRIAVAVETRANGGAPLPAFTLTSKRSDPALLPSTRYMQLLIDGAVEHGLPAAYVTFLRSIPARPESRAAAHWRPLIERALRRE